MNDGYWINYITGKSFEIDEHERWIRNKANAKRIGVPARIFKQFDQFVPGEERCRFLRWLMKQVPLMRLRGHGGLYCTFEFVTKLNKAPYKMILKIAKQMPPTQLLNIVNLATGRSEQVSALLFTNNFKKT